MTVFRDRRFRAVAIALGAIKLWLTAAQPLTATVAALASDRSFLSIAEHLLSGGGFGPEGATGLTVGPMLPVWIAFTYLVGIPASVANHVLYLCGCYAMVRALRWQLPGDGAKLALFGILCWNPMTFHAPGLTQVGPWSLLAWETLLLTAGLTGVLCRRDACRTTLAIWGGLAGSGLASLLLTIGPTAWIAVALVAWLTALAVCAVRYPQHRGGAAVSIGSLLVSAGILLGAYCHFSYWKHGTFGLDEMRSWSAASVSTSLPRELERASCAATIGGFLRTADAVGTFKTFTALTHPSTVDQTSRRRLSRMMQWPVTSSAQEETPSAVGGQWRITVLNGIGKGLRLLYALLIYGGLLAWLWRAMRRGHHSALWWCASFGLFIFVTMLLTASATWPDSTASSLPRRLAGAYPVALLFAVVAWLDAWRSWRSVRGGLPDVREPERAPPTLAALRTAARFPRWVAANPWRQALVFGLLGIAIVLVRKTDALYNPQLWAEDGDIFFSQNARFGAAMLFETYAGYLHLIPRLIAWIGGHLSACNVPAFYVWSALVCFGFTTARLFSPRLALPNKPLLALALALVPHQGEIFATPTNIQWFSALLFPMLLVSDDARTRAQQARDMLIAVVVGLTGPFSILVAPLFLLRWWRRRTRQSLLLLVVVGGCAAVQAAFILGTPSAPVPRSGAPDLVNLIAVLSRRLPLQLVVGRLDSAIFTAPVIIAAGIVLLGLLGWITVHSRASRWCVLILWILVFLIPAASAYKDRIDLYHLKDLHNGDRYFVMPRVLMLWLLACSATWRTWPGRVAALVLVLSLASNLPHFLTPPYVDHHWEEYCERLDADTYIVVPVNPGSTFVYPGSTTGEHE